jgi:hypothetical protein
MVWPLAYSFCLCLSWPCLVHSFELGRVAYVYFLFLLDVTLSHNSCEATIDPTTMTFPAEMLVDYVRVYQREGQTNIGCNPPGYPTTDYISNHPEAYNSLSCSHRGISFMLAYSLFSCRSAVVVLDIWTRWRELYAPEELAGTFHKFCSLTFLICGLNE